jgi:hypothetical protein
MNKIQQLIAQHCPNGVEFKKLGEVCEIYRRVRKVSVHSGNSAARR